MNYGNAISKLLRRTCLALNNQNAEVNTNPMGWRCYYKHEHTPCNSDAMTTAALMTSRRFYSNYILSQYNSVARVGTAPPLTEEKAYALMLTLTELERAHLKAALTKYEIEKQKEGFEELTWRTKFGRLSTTPALANVDPTGAYCTFPEDWLKSKTEAKMAPPATRDLAKIFFVNAVPFLAFGFLDNFCMIMAGDVIEEFFGTFMCISTMAAAGLGNTISDIIGIGTAFYVERFCTVIGLKPPDLNATQMEMKQTRRASNFGRIIGITIGCLIGMFPLLFIEEFKSNTKSEKETRNS